MHIGLVLIVEFHQLPFSCFKPESQRQAPRGGSMLTPFTVPVQGRSINAPPPALTVRQLGVLPDDGLKEGGADHGGGDTALPVAAPGASLGALERALDEVRCPGEAPADGTRADWVTGWSSLRPPCCLPGPWVVHASLGRSFPHQAAEEKSGSDARPGYPPMSALGVDAGPGGSLEALTLIHSCISSQSFLSAPSARPCTTARRYRKKSEMRPLL